METPGVRQSQFHDAFMKKPAKFNGRERPIRSDRLFKADGTPEIQPGRRSTGSTAV
jgi:hypothetical protein